VTRKTFEGYDEPVNIDMDPEEALKLILNAKTRDPASDVIEPVLDE